MFKHLARVSNIDCIAVSCSKPVEVNEIDQIADVLQAFGTTFSNGDLLAASVSACILNQEVFGGRRGPLNSLPRG